MSARTRRVIPRPHGHVHGHDMPQDAAYGAMARCCCKQWVVFEMRGDDWTRHWYPVRKPDLVNLRRAGVVV